MTQLCFLHFRPQMLQYVCSSLDSTVWKNRCARMSKDVLFLFLPLLLPSSYSSSSFPSSSTTHTHQASVHQHLSPHLSSPVKQLGTWWGGRRERKEESVYPKTTSIILCSHVVVSSAGATWCCQFWDNTVTDLCVWASVQNQKKKRIVFRCYQPWYEVFKDFLVIWTRFLNQPEWFEVTALWTRWPGVLQYFTCYDLN